MTKKITTLCCTVAMLATTAATPALSQSKNFAGPSFSVYALNNKGTVVADDGSQTLTAKDTKFAYGLDAAYTFGLQNNFFVTLGATYQINDTSFGKFTDSTDEDRVSSYENTKQHSYYISPMFALNDNTALFLKASLNTINIVETYDSTDKLDIKIKDKVGYGLGVQHMFNKNLFAKLEYEKIDFGSKTVADVKYSPETEGFKIGIGYKF